MVGQECSWYADANKQVCFSKNMGWGKKMWKGAKNMWNKWAKKGGRGGMKNMWKSGKFANMNKMWKGKHGKHGKHGRRGKHGKHGRRGKHQKIFMKNPVMNVYNKFEDLNLTAPAVGKWNTPQTAPADPCAIATTEAACTTPQA